MRHSVLAFVNRHADAFEALTRMGNPFGGSLLATSRSSAKVRATGKARKEIAYVQQQVGELSRTVAQLSDQVDQLSMQTLAKSRSGKSGAAGRSVNCTRDIGINRYRALHGKA